MPNWSHEKQREALRKKDEKSTSSAQRDQLTQDWATIPNSVVLDFIRFCNSPGLAVSTVTADMATFKAGQLAALKYFLDSIEKGKDNEQQKAKQSKNV